jgi:hypothetical protein
MASRSTYSVKSLGRELVAVVGSFAPNGSSAPQTVKGKGFTVARTGAGQFTITFTDKYYDLVSIQSTLQLASAAASVVQVGAYSATNKTLVLTVLTESSGALVAADVSANANNRVNFTCWFRNSSVE